MLVSGVSGPVCGGLRFRGLAPSRGLVACYHATMTDEETRAMTLRLPAELHEWLRREAFERRVAMNALVVTAIERDRDERAKGAAA